MSEYITDLIRRTRKPLLVLLLKNKLLAKRKLHLDNIIRPTDCKLRDGMKLPSWLNSTCSTPVAGQTPAEHSRALLAQTIGEHQVTSGLSRSQSLQEKTDTWWRQSNWTRQNTLAPRVNFNVKTPKGSRVYSGISGVGEVPKEYVGINRTWIVQTLWAPLNRERNTNTVEKISMAACLFLDVMFCLDYLKLPVNYLILQAWYFQKLPVSLQIEGLYISSSAALKPCCVYWLQNQHCRERRS